MMTQATALAQAFEAAVRQGWQEISGEVVPTVLEGQALWDVLQQQMQPHPYPQTRIGLGFRAGRCGFHAMLDLTGETLGLRNRDFRLHPVQKRLSIGFASLVQLCQVSGFPALAGKISEDYHIELGDSMLEVQRGYLMGFFQEFFEWASQGRAFPITKGDIKGFCFASEPLNL